MYLLIVGSYYCVMRFAYALHMCRQNLVLVFCLYTEPLELVMKIKMCTGAWLGGAEERSLVRDKGLAYNIYIYIYIFAHVSKPISQI